MKRFLLASILCIITIGAYAQHHDEEHKANKKNAKRTEITTEKPIPASEKEDTVIEVRINGELADLGGGWELMWKAALLIIWTAIITLFVIRTFRGKAEV